MNVLMLALWVLFLPATETETVLYQVDNIPCSQTTTFICSSNTQGGFIEWRVTPEEGQDILTILNTHDYNDTELVKFGRGVNIDVIGRLYFGNVSSFNSSLMIPAYLTSNITCNENSLYYQPCNYSECQPTRIMLTPVSEGLLILQWNFVSSNCSNVTCDNVSYNVQVFLDQAISMEYITSAESLLLSIVPQMLQNITIWLSNCSNVISTFPTGCPLLANSRVTYYEVYNNETMIAIIRETDDFGSNTIIECYNNEWEANLGTTTYTLDETSTEQESKFQVIIVFTACIILAILLFTTLVPMVLTILIRKKLKKVKRIKDHKSDEIHSSDHIEEEAVYVEINNTCQVLPVETKHDSSEYSTLQHGSFSTSFYQKASNNKGCYDSVTIPSKLKVSVDDTVAEYSRIQIKQRVPMQSNYSDVELTSKGNHQPNLIQIDVHYSEVNLQVKAADCNLNLDTLLVQLLPIRNEYQLFGRVAGISSDKLDNISASTKEPYDALVEVCDLWLQSCKARKIPPTWRLVAEILTVMGQDELSKGILKVYETGKLPIQVNVSVPQVKQESSTLRSVATPNNKLSPNSSSPPPLPPRWESDSEGKV